MKTPKAIALLSGGLDSTLAAKIVKDQGVDVIGLHLVSPFGCKTEVEKNAAAIGVPVLFREKGEAFLDMVQNPKFGYGRAMNPCIDCRVFMFDIAEKVRLETAADFIVTGEVLGQRPMSQQRNSMRQIDNEADAGDRILRPLSAHFFDPTIAEKQGWVNRDEMFGISGRSRKEQKALAESLGITDYAAPGGGCLLTETGFGDRLKDFYQFPAHQTSEERLAQSELLRLGRHFRVRDNLKIVIGRNENENAEMEKISPRANALYFIPENFDGPSAVVLGEASKEDLELAGKLVWRYGRNKAPTEEKIIRYSGRRLDGLVKVIEPLSDERIESWRI